MRETLLSLEKRFFDSRYISDRKWLESVLHDDFTECGRSGILYHKKETANGLLLCGKDRDIDIYRFECTRLGKEAWLAHYITVSDNSRYFRSSVWVCEGEWQLLFHQATELCMELDLGNRE